ncbi:D-sedoheptulose 7-phosphate isomerase [Cerasicoccus arenae]|uniref:Phosphoheptose isomerase n=1 Tax=Cerasicoccus arenae TaxID=424488 RepID=A0A8J3DD19_9BACT|nr:D-sedoheptulose 7-phosphate isomerase [Cerasicoccus arenae]MBK1858630.1 D-sedoheptulose 7-phosphate isomerase [Cerasicoccus arenae]GHC04890.1 phosphoheptose isomerase [Cerasicoccus arenae]
MEAHILKQINELGEVVAASRSLAPKISDSGRHLIKVLRSGGKILTCGNGGSATDALHLAEEFVGRYDGERASLPAICLSADVSVLTCIANDYGFEAVFSRAVEGLGHPGDVLVGISTSGNSANILRAFEAAKAKGMTTILLSGKDGGKARGQCDYEIIAPSETTARIQEIHTLILHCWLEMVEAETW